jgi:hypothetical protein
MLCVYVVFSSSMNAHLISSPQSIGPLYPFPNYKIINSMLISASSFCAIGLVCCFVLFPETVNHAYLGLISVMLEKVKALLAAQDGFLSPQLGDYRHSEECPKLKTLIGLRTAVMTMYESREYASYRRLKLPLTVWLFSGRIESPPSKRVQHWPLEWR